MNKQLQQQLKALRMAQLRTLPYWALDLCMTTRDQDRIRLQNLTKSIWTTRGMHHIKFKDMKESHIQRVLHLVEYNEFDNEPEEYEKLYKELQRFEKT